MTYLINPFFCYCCYLPEVKSKRNSALKTPITVSSVLNKNYGDYHPYYATDGLVPNGFTKMFHSAFESFPLITVDLFSKKKFSNLFLMKIFLLNKNYHINKN